MEDLNHPLSEEEIERLDQFLLNRVDDQFIAEGMDEGIFDISTLDGFLTAIASGPVTIPPSVWLPSIWGDFEPEWENEEAFSEILSLLIRHLNGIVTTLMECPEDFEPLYLERIVENTTVLIVDEWCEGYHRGTELSPDHWRSGGKEMAALLSPILAFTAATDWKGHDKPYDVVESIQLKIAPNARQIHAYWLSRRDEIPQDELLKQRDPPPGRPQRPLPLRQRQEIQKVLPTLIRADHRIPYP